MKHGQRDKIEKMVGEGRWVTLCQPDRQGLARGGSAWRTFGLGGFFC